MGVKPGESFNNKTRQREKSSRSEDKIVLGDCDREQSHDGSDHPQESPAALSGRALRLPAIGTDGQADRDFLFTELAIHRLISEKNPARGLRGSSKLAVASRNRQHH
ncbi:hypothetical protein ABIB73_000011 [Bradyrhizobium sp. F1.4.3]|uniref:hypothetical protein n=1 Tax=Bradyrhizobium sp. F1.4.3 TaxID=3156356 RepID=UPI003395D4FD